MIRDDTDAYGGHGMTSSDDPFATPDAPDDVDVVREGRLTRARRRLDAVVTLFTRRS